MNHASEDGYTNSSLTCFKSCPARYNFNYNMKLELDREGREELAVGNVWHKAHEAINKPGGVPMHGYEVIGLLAPSPLWREKLRRMLAGHLWYYSNDPLKVVNPEQSFKEIIDGITLRGQIDGDLEQFDVYSGIMDYKTTSESLHEGSPLWSMLIGGTQASTYTVAREHQGKPPRAVMFDVVKKPTIRRKKLTIAEVRSMRISLNESGQCTYFGEPFDEDELNEAVEEKKETIRMYGARLGRDINNKPTEYFKRKLVPYSPKVLSGLIVDIHGWAAQIKTCEDSGVWPRNRGNCSQYGRCDYIKLCDNHIQVLPGVAPEGYRFRTATHPELETS